MEETDKLTDRSKCYLGPNTSTLVAGV